MGTGMVKLSRLVTETEGSSVPQEIDRDAKKEKQAGEPGNRW